MKKILILLGFASILVLNSCVGKSAPENDVGFEKIKQLTDLNGCYINKAECEKGSINRYLSTHILPGSDISPKKIKHICIRALNNTKLKVSAKSYKLSNLIEKTYTLNQDFKISSGKIKLKSRTENTLDGTGNANVLGMMHESISLGIDLNGNGKYNSSSTGGILLPIPVIMHLDESCRFRKIN